MAALDLRFLVRELRGALVGGFIKKIFQYGNRQKQFLLEVNVPGTGTKFLYIDRKKLFLAAQKPESPPEPPQFCMFLRKRLAGSKILEIEQRGFDRIVAIATAEHVLIFEFLEPGNVILTDMNGMIALPLELQTWKDRVIKPKVRYSPPPSPLDPFTLEFNDVVKLAEKHSKKLVVFVASILGLGGVYAREVCVRAKVDEQLPANQVPAADLSRVVTALRSLEKEQLMAVRYETIVSPFPLHSAPIHGARSFPSFSAALDDYFTHEVAAASQKHVKEKEGKQVYIKQQQEKALEKWRQIEQESRRHGELLSSHVAEVDAVLSWITKTRKTRSWDNVLKERPIAPEPIPSLLKDIHPDQGQVIIELENTPIIIDVRKAALQNAAEKFQRAKKAKNKVAGIHKAMKREIARSTPKKEKVRAQGKGTFLTFTSVDGTRILAGRDAETNEQLIKKQTGPNDLVFHADITGAAFVVVKGPASEQTKQEAAVVAAVHSKAWQRGLGTADVFAVTPDQLSKKPQSGEYLPTGSFVVRGKRTWYRNVPLAVTITIVKAEEFEIVPRYGRAKGVVVVPGGVPAPELARQIKGALLSRASKVQQEQLVKLPATAFEQYIPGGKGQLAL